MRYKNRLLVMPLKPDAPWFLLPALISADWA